MAVSSRQRHQGGHGRHMHFMLVCYSTVEAKAAHMPLMLGQLSICPILHPQRPWQLRRSLYILFIALRVLQVALRMIGTRTLLLLAVLLVTTAVHAQDAQDDETGASKRQNALLDAKLKLVEEAAQKRTATSESIHVESHVVEEAPAQLLANGMGDVATTGERWLRWRRVAAHHMGLTVGLDDLQATARRTSSASATGCSRGRGASPSACTGGWAKRRGAMPAVRSRPRCSNCPHCCPNCPCCCPAL